MPRNFSGTPWLAIACAAVLLLATATRAAARSRVRRTPIGPVLESDTQVLGYDVLIYRDQEGCGGAYFEVNRGSHLIYTSHPLCDAVLRVGALSSDDPDEKFLWPGNDLIGNGHPDLVVSGYTGGASCCLVFYMFELKPKFRSLGKIQTRDTDQLSPHFVRLEPGGGAELILHDWTFARWHASFESSPAPIVMLEYKNGGWRVASEVMREPAPTQAELETKANNVRLDTMAENYNDPFRTWPDAKIPSSMWANMLNLIYTGHPDLAWKFLDLAWPAEIRGKDRFLADFRAQLKHSPYYDEIEEMATKAASSTASSAAPAPAS